MSELMSTSAANVRVRALVHAPLVYEGVTMFLYGPIDVCLKFERNDLVITFDSGPGRITLPLSGPTWWRDLSNLSSVLKAAADKWEQWEAKRARGRP